MSPKVTVRDGLAPSAHRPTSARLDGPFWLEFLVSCTISFCLCSLSIHVEENNCRHSDCRFGCLLRFDPSAESSCVRVDCIGSSVPPLRSAQEQDRESPKQEVRELRRHEQSSFTRIAAARHMKNCLHIKCGRGLEPTSKFCRLRMLPLPVIPFLSCLVPLIPSSSAQHGNNLSCAATWRAITSSP